MFPAIAKRRLNYGLRSNLTSDLTDLAGKTWTANGGAVVSGGELQLGGTGDYLDTPYSADFHFTSSQDVTIRCKVNAVSFASDFRAVLSARVDVTYIKNWFIYLSPNGVRLFIASGGSGSALVDKTWGSVFSFGTEFELSLERKSMVWYLYKDGNQIATTVTQSGDYTVDTSSYLTIGSEVHAGGGTGRDLNGSVRYVQIIKNKAMGNGGSTTPLI